MDRVERVVERMEDGGTRVRNVLFIMCDQLRADYLGYDGHPYLDTPAIDSLAGRGVAFRRAYVQAPVCGGSRMSFYTGRYAYCHGAHYNNFPLRIDEQTLGDYLAPLGIRTLLAGKTHVSPDLEALSRLGIDPYSDIGSHIVQGGFEPFDRDDGLHPGPVLDPNQRYCRYLHERGYESPNPWHDFVNSAAGSSGEILSGWHMRNARRPARVREEDSETAYITTRAIELIEGLGDTPWCIHLSYIKPHWPYIAPAPYHALYDNAQLIRANRSEDERRDPHPVIAAFMRHDESECFARDEVRETVIPTYMGLIRQIDDHLARLLGVLAAQGRMDDTLIVFTSDHGDYLGDHWLGEKDLFHEEIVRIPLVVFDPSPEADATRGKMVDSLVESIDLIPTFLEALGGEIPAHRLEGRSLLALIRGRQPDDWRDAVFCDSDYGLRKARRWLGLAPHEARAFMVRTADWKYVDYRGFRPQLFNLQEDPGELNDLGADPAFADRRREMRDRLHDWMASRRLRTTVSDERIAASSGTAHERGYLFGVW